MPLLVIQILISFLLILLVIIQNQGTGLGRTWGTTQYHSKKGLERTFFLVTIFIGALFALVSLLNLLL